VAFGGAFEPFLRRSEALASWEMGETLPWEVLQRGIVAAFWEGGEVKDRLEERKEGKNRASPLV